jgi:tRNA (guanine37-N1)-methyltransferase
MVLKPEPIFAAVRDLPKKESQRIILLSPQGKVFNQKTAQRLAGYEEGSLALRPL